VRADPFFFVAAAAAGFPFGFFLVGVAQNLFPS
jgi:hypothetical protein